MASTEEESSSRAEARFDSGANPERAKALNCPTNINVPEISATSGVHCRCRRCPSKLLSLGHSAFLRSVAIETPGSLHLMHVTRDAAHTGAMVEPLFAYTFLFRLPTEEALRGLKTRFESSQRPSTAKFWQEKGSTALCRVPMADR